MASLRGREEPFNFLELPRELRDRIYDTFLIPEYQSPKSLCVTGDRVEAKRYLIQLCYFSSKLLQANEQKVTSTTSATKQPF